MNYRLVIALILGFLILGVAIGLMLYLRKPQAASVGPLPAGRVSFPPPTASATKQGVTVLAINNQTKPLSSVAVSLFKNERINGITKTTPVGDKITGQDGKAYFGIPASGSYSIEARWGSQIRTRSFTYKSPSIFSTTVTFSGTNAFPTNPGLIKPPSPTPPKGEPTSSSAANSDY